MIHEARQISAEGESLDLDPFAFWPDIQSRIVGFGGNDRGENPDYAFHTRYVSCGTGPIVFTVRFEGLAATRGTLILRIHELPEVMGAHARQIALSQTQLIDLIRGDGRVTLPAAARDQNHYALLGYIYGDTVATARAVAIEVARRSPDPMDPSRPTIYNAGSDRVGAAPQIVGEREGTLVTPVSQLCTKRQMVEPVLRAVLEQIGGSDEVSPLDRWEHAFIARVLDRYDVARSGARGLGVAAPGDPLVGWLAKHGCSQLLTTMAATAEDNLPPGVELCRMSPSAIAGLSGFDFAWATRAGGVGSTDRQAVLQFIEDVLRALKPGGLMTLVVALDVSPRPIGDDSGPLMRRPDIDRISLVLLSRGHQIAQICPWGDAVVEAEGDGMTMISAFGMIVRKAG